MTATACLGSVVGSADRAAIRPMLKTLELSRYRGFESYRLGDLTRVNLLVGMNNCGKTSILEAVELLVSGGSVSALYESAVRRGELDDDSGYGADVSHVFYGHECTPGARFDLSSFDSQQRLAGTILSLEEVGEAADRWERMEKRRGFELEDGAAAAFGLSLVAGGREPFVVPVAENGSLTGRFWGRSARGVASRREVRFVDFEPASMQTAWNAVVADRRETEVVEAMRILMPDIDSVLFLPGRRRHNILVGRRNARSRFPVGSFGDGMRRLLAVSLALVGGENGCLLIDEIDTGFHWTVMEDMWRLVVEGAGRSNVQVFATTHSYDCIKGLGELVRTRPDLAESVSVHKVHRKLEQAVAIPGGEIPIAVEQDIEVR